MTKNMTNMTNGAGKTDSDRVTLAPYPPIRAPSKYTAAAEVKLPADQRGAKSVTKDEAERTIRHLCRVYAKNNGIIVPSPNYISWHDFKNLLSDHEYSHYLKFRCRLGADETAENWFDEEFKQAGGQ
ncbi:hypothetical protein [Methylobacterium sp. Leaf123]|uniref:hypothetical protein n=1 Tax=Methylobacterium sp. Leaf123 TaxID=1736264 RepID=UPI000A800F93|nr:hypothetical protein [Methylobacterium sp. Leaf123]